MPNTTDVFNFLKSIAPLEMKMDNDNSGFLVGFGEAAVSKILLSLDITHEVISEARNSGAELIVAHHPLPFLPLKSVTDMDNTGHKIIRLLTSGISAICMHTNLDAAQGGVNDALANAAGIADTVFLSDDGVTSSGDRYSYGRFGFLPKPMPMREYLPMLKAALNAQGLRYHDAGKDVYKVAVVGGSGGDYFEHALKQGCDTFVTADIKYSLFIQAKEMGLNLIDGDHFSTENLVIAPLAEKLRAQFPDADIQVSKTHVPTAGFHI